MKKNLHKQGNYFGIFLLQVIAVALAAAGLLVYMATGKNTFTPDLSTTLIGGIIVFIVAQILVILMFFFIKGEQGKPIIHLCQFVVAIVGILSLVLFITNNVNYLASIIAAIDGTPITVEFIGTTVLLLGAFILSLVVANIAVSAKLGGKGDER